MNKHQNLETKSKNKQGSTRSKIISRLKSIFGRIDVGVILATIGYFVQQRFWIFSKLYSNISTDVGKGNDTFYVISLYFQNALNFLQGNIFSMEGDHYVWYDKIIASTAHGIAPSFLFIGLFELTQNAVLSYNILYFVNVLIMQVGLFVLVRYYTKNNTISFFAGFFLPLSEATKMYYTNHLHSFYYWALPLIIYTTEKFFDTIKDQSYTRRSTGIFAIAIFLLTTWTALSEWHILIFSSLFLGIFFTFRIKFILTAFAQNRAPLIIYFSSFALGILTVTPIAINTLDASNLHQAVRSPYDISYEAKPINQVLNLAFPFRALIKETNSVFEFPNDQELEKLIQALQNNTGIIKSYPDILTTTLLWILPLLLLIGLYYLLQKKININREITFGAIFIFSLILALGPYFKVDSGFVNYYIKLPHYYISKIFFPLQAIRNINRVYILAYFAGLILISLLFNRLSVFLAKHLTKNQVRYGNVFVVITLLLFSLFLNEGWRGPSEPAVSINSNLQNVFTYIKTDAAKLNQEQSDVYFIADSSQNDLYNVNFGYNESYFNYKNRGRFINSVSGGIAGIYPRSTILNSYEDTTDKKDIENMAIILAGKKVDYVIAENRPEDSPLVQSLLRYYSYQEYNSLYAILTLKDNGESLLDGLIHVDSPDITLSLPSTIDQNTRVLAYINYGNLESTIFINSQTVVSQEYTLEYLDSNHTAISTHTLHAGGEPFLLPKSGKRFTLKHTPNLQPGEYTARLSRDEQEVVSQKVTVLSHKDWNRLIDDNQAVAPLLRDITFDYEFRGDSFTRNDVYIQATLDQGIINPQNILAGKDSNLSFTYANKDGSVYPFPQWIEFPDCRIDTTYTPGDTIKIWCPFIQPADYTFDTFNYTISTSPEPNL